MRPTNDAENQRRGCGGFEVSGAATIGRLPMKHIAVLLSAFGASLRLSGKQLIRKWRS